MEERRHDGSTRLTESVNDGDIARARKALEMGLNDSFSLLAPGSRVERFKDGHRYVMVVQSDGTLLPEVPTTREEEKEG